MTEARPFQLLADRLAGLPIDETLHDDVPEWLDQPLRDWLQAVFTDEGSTGSDRLASRVLMRLRWAKDNPRQTYFSRLAASTRAELLTVVDGVLQLHPAWDPPVGIPASLFMTKLRGLDDILTDAGSLYRIDFNGRCLVRRVDATVQAAVEAAIATATSTAADHLRTAWVAAYGLHPDPDKAYDHAVLAIEELACPLVCPRNNRATLGTVISDLRNQVAQWELSIENTSTGQPSEIDSIIQMLDLLWKGQSRHAGNPNSRQQTQAEAEAAVHMAAALTQWLTAGVLHRK
jgi:hypothetical protein